MVDYLLYLYSNGMLFGSPAGCSLAKIAILQPSIPPSPNCCDTTQQPRRDLFHVDLQLLILTLSTQQQSSAYKQDLQSLYHSSEVAAAQGGLYVSEQG